MEALVGVLRGEIHPQVHCYRQDEILRLFALADEFGFQIAGLHHCLEGYKVANEIARHGAVVCTWPDWYGFKLEAWQTTPYAIKILTDKGATVAIHSDSADIVQRFNVEAAKTLRYGMTEEQALKLITINPARALGLQDRVGSIEKGKDADLVIFDRNPFSVYARVEATIIDGQIFYEKGKN
jgi:imidazolonepropionase-like amidohydrolase